MSFVVAPPTIAVITTITGGGGGGGEPQPPANLVAALGSARALCDPGDRPLVDAVTRRVFDLAKGRERLPWSAVAAFIAAVLHPRRDPGEVEALSTAITTGTAPIDSKADLAGLFASLLHPVEAPPACRPVDLPGLLGALSAAVDPTRPDAAARSRVLGRLPGLDAAAPLAPTEVCVGVDVPVWQFVEAIAADWLLPGANTLEENGVVLMRTNPVFVDAVLVGLNAQLLGELRWRNIPFDTGCTPMRVFWDRANTAAGHRVDDIHGVATWEPTSTLGDVTHQAGAAGADLVLVFRGPLFARYPQTLISLISAVHDGGAPDFGRDPEPDAARILPSFQGRIRPDIAFFGFDNVAATDVARFWAAAEEPDVGYRFANDNTPEVAGVGEVGGGRFAHLALVDPVRVLLSGAELVSGAQR